MVWAQKNAWLQANWSTTQNKQWQDANLGVAKGHDTRASGNDRNDYEGTKMGTIATICGQDWNNFYGTAFEGTMAMITLFVMPEVQIFDHILKYS